MKANLTFNLSLTLGLASAFLRPGITNAATIELTHRLTSSTFNTDKDGTALAINSVSWRLTCAAWRSRR